MKVSIQAPEVIIPVSSTSRDALVANLGHLSVSNTFNLAHDGKDPEGSDTVVIDNMVVELSSVKLSRYWFHHLFQRFWNTVDLMACAAVYTFSLKPLLVAIWAGVELLCLDIV